MHIIIALAVLFSPAAAHAKKGGPLRPLAEELVRTCEGADKDVAVVWFSYTDGRDSRDGAMAAERLTEELYALKKIRVITREQLELGLGKTGLQRQDAMDTLTARKVGKLAGADYVIFGTLTELPDRRLELKARIIGAELGELVNNASGRAAKDWLDQYRNLLEGQNRAIERDPKDAQAFYEKGVMYADLWEYDNAIASYNIAISIDQAYFKAYFSRGNAYRGLGEFDKAIEDFTQAITLDPKPAAPYASRASAYVVNGEYDKAIKDASRAVTSDPNGILSYLTRGDAYNYKAEYDKAIDDYSMAIALDPKHAIAYASRAAAYNSVSAYDKAVKDASRSMARA